jgi:hypothetical protein
MNIPDHTGISESLVTIFGLKISVLKFLVASSDPGSGPGVFLVLDPGPGIRDGKIRIRNTTVFKA